jgi:demethylmenaquinone methyltransferase/2-methoxy-6-polyprenyl-1,4-benzoquinol methylase
MDSIKDWPTQAVLSQWLRAAGYEKVEYKNLSAGIVALHRGVKPRSAAGTPNRPEGT